MNEPISLTYHQAQAVAERAARVRRLAKQRGSGFTGRERVIVTLGNPYYSEPRPENHGYYLTVEGRGSAPVPLFAKDLGYERNFEAARLPPRDQDGHVQHPDMDGIGWDEFDMGPQLRALGWESKTVCFEHDASHEAQERYDEGNSPDCSYWTPSRPEGNGWLLAAIYDTEDGPVALYVRSADGVGACPICKGAGCFTCGEEHRNAGVLGIDTADHVHHGPTGETWVVARVDREYLHPCGWPPSRADLKDCTLVKKATPAERTKLLQELASGRSEHAAWAKDALGVMVAPVVGPSGSDWELVGYFMEDGGRWLKMDNIYKDDPDAVPLYRKRNAGAGGTDGS